MPPSHGHRDGARAPETGPSAEAPPKTGGSLTGDQQRLTLAGPCLWTAGPRGPLPGERSAPVCQRSVAPAEEGAARLWARGPALLLPITPSPSVSRYDGDTLTCFTASKNCPWESQPSTAQRPCRWGAPWPEKVPPIEGTRRPLLCPAGDPWAGLEGRGTEAPAVPRGLWFASHGALSS